MEEGAKADQFVNQIAIDWQKADLGDANRALCRFAEKLTRDQHSMRPDDIEELRSNGFTDEAIHDATQVIAYFNYITRIADALGVDHETFIPAWENRN